MSAPTGGRAAASTRGRDDAAALGEPAEIEAPLEWDAPATRVGRAASHVRRALLGAPLKTTALAGERMRKLVALPVLSADALSSVAYGPEAMLVVLVAAGAGGLRLELPVAAAIAVLMLAVGTSYRQTLIAYPQGGGSYVVATQNLGRLAGLLAAGGLITDYVMTVAVSVTSGLDAITSALPSLAPMAVPVGVAVIALLLMVNLRGVRQAGTVFAAPTYAFLLAMFLVVVAGLVAAAGRGFHTVPAPVGAPVEGLGLLLVLRAFASGATAMTGIETISNAVPAFKQPAGRNARTTLGWMIVLLVGLFAGTVALVHLDGITPQAGETVLSQLAHRGLGSGPAYAFVQASTAAVLLLAANTAFNGFPRLLSLMARDHQAPHRFGRLGDRLAYSNGIVALALLAAAALVASGARTDRLIPLYAVGVFLAFCLSQSGMVVHWWRGRDPHWRRAMALNGAGALLSGLVFLIAAVTKLSGGSWVALVSVGLVVVSARAIRRHYASVEHALALPPGQGRAVAVGETSGDVRSLVVVPLARLDLAAIRALEYAGSLGQPVLVVHVCSTEEGADEFRAAWKALGDPWRLEVVVSPYRALVAPLAHYVAALHRRRPGITITVVIAEAVFSVPWQRALHSDVEPRLRRALRPLHDVVVTSVPFHVTPQEAA